MGVKLQVEQQQQNHVVNSWLLKFNYRLVQQESLLSVISVSSLTMAEFRVCYFHEMWLSTNLVGRVCEDINCGEKMYLAIGHEYEVEKSNFLEEFAWTNVDLNQTKTFAFILFTRGVPFFSRLPFEI